MGMDDLLKALLAGATGGPEQGQDREQQQGSIDINELLQGLLGGMTAPEQGSGQPGYAFPQQQAQQGGGGLGDILGSILGGGAAGGTGSGAGSGPASFLGPIIQGLAKQLGLPPAMAQIVVSFAMSKLLPGLLGGLTPKPQQAIPSRTPAPSQSGGFDLDDLLDRVGSGNAQRVSASYLRSTGLASELAQQTGLDEDTAASSLQHVFLALGGQMGGPAQAASQRRTAKRPRTKSGTTASKKSTPKKKKTPDKKDLTWEV